MGPAVVPGGCGANASARSRRIMTTALVSCEYAARNGCFAGSFVYPDVGQRASKTQDPFSATDPNPAGTGAVRLPGSFGSSVKFSSTTCARRVEEVARLGLCAHEPVVTLADGGDDLRRPAVEPEREQRHRAVVGDGDVRAPRRLACDRMRSLRIRPVGTGKAARVGERLEVVADLAPGSRSSPGGRASRVYCDVPSSPALKTTPTATATARRRPSSAGRQGRSRSSFEPAEDARRRRRSPGSSPRASRSG